MGNLDVRIRHGGGGGSSGALTLAVVGLALAFGGSIMTAVGTIVSSLLVTLAIVVGVLLVAAIALLLVFRKRTAAHFRPSPVVWQQIGPDRPALAPVQPKQEVHLHFHGDSPEAIRRAVKAAELAGGGTIIVPAGEFDMRQVR